MVLLYFKSASLYRMKTTAALSFFQITVRELAIRYRLLISGVPKIRLLDVPTVWKRRGMPR